MSENLKIWDALKTPPKSAMKKISGGRLNNMTDIKPQWRLQAMTEQFGPVGFGWKYTIERMWIEAGSEGQFCAFSHIKLSYKSGSEWSEPFDGIGGSMLVTKEKAGPHTSDECYKMATTDALSVAMKAIGVGADVYLGNVSHDSKYHDKPKDQPKVATITEGQAADLDALIEDVKSDKPKFLKYFNITTSGDLPATQFKKACEMLEAKR